jgi:hypothetical protein
MPCLRLRTSLSSMLSDIDKLANRISALESVQSHQDDVKVPACARTVLDVDIERDLRGVDSDVSKRLRSVCAEIGLLNAEFKRAPSDYYDWSLEQRRDFLGASSTSQLCKTIVMVCVSVCLCVCVSPCLSLCLSLAPSSKLHVPCSFPSSLISPDSPRLSPALPYSPLLSDASSPLFSCSSTTTK